jgi:hypothetical protein
MPRAKVLTIIGELGDRARVNLIHKRLSKSGFLVFVPPQPTLDTPEEITALDVNTLGCIEHSHAVFVIDPGGFQDLSTQRHVAYAHEHNKMVFLLSTKGTANNQIMNTIEMGKSITDDLGDSGEYRSLKKRSDRHADRFNMRDISAQRSSLLSMKETITSKLAED